MLSRRADLNPGHPDLAARVAEAWQVLCNDALQVRRAAAEIARLHPTDPDVQGHAAAFDARGRLSEGDRAGCEASLARAEALFAQGRDPEGPLACVDLRVFLLTRDTQFEAALATLAPALEQIGPMPPSVLGYFLLKRRAAVFEQQGHFDEALRAHHVAVAMARQSGHPGALANGLAALGGFQASELNYSDALPVCEEAWALCRSTDWFGMIGAVAPNLMMARSGVGQHAAAAELADQLLQIDHHLPLNQRDRRLFMYGIVYDRAGRPADAQRCLDQGQALRPASAPHRSEWVWAQAGLWNQQARWAEALALVTAYLDQGAQAVNGADFPVDQACLHQQAALACEGLGNFAQALAFERQAAQARERAHRRTSHAQRLSLQISMELDAAHQQRDEALHKQAQLAALNARLNEANEAKSRFLAAASHDLRQPVHALALQAAALRQALNHPRQFEMLAGIERCAGALGSMFDALLDLSRMDAGALQPQPQPVDLDELLLRLVDELAPIAHAKGLRLALRVAGGSAPGSRRTLSDPALLEAMLRNLVGNALKYTPSGTVLVTVRPAQAASAWRLQVWDTGIGIPLADQARVFDEFYQVGNPARRRELGLGLGLATVHRLAGLLDHGLSLRSVPGRGSCFEVRLPVLGAPIDTLADPDCAPASLDLHVAVIEDDPEVQASVRLLLSAWGCRVSLGESAEEVIAAWGQAGAPPQAVLADLRLPGPLNGAEEVARLRQCLQRPLPALVLTGDVAPATVALLASQGLPWLPKPAPVVQLLAWLAAVDPAG